MIFITIVLICNFLASPAVSTNPWFSEPIPNVTVTAGSNVSLPCVVNNLGNYRVAWIKPDTHTLLTLHNQVIARNPRLSIKIIGNHTFWLNIRDVQGTDRGPYWCQINTSPMIHQIVYLEVTFPTKLSSPEATDLRVKTGSSFNLTCTMSNLPDEPEWVNWLRGVQEDEGSGEEFYSIDDGIDGYYKGEILPLEKVGEHTWISRLYLTNAQPEDSGKYQCEIHLHELVFNVHVLNVQTPTSDGCPMSLHNWILFLLLLTIRGSWFNYQKHVY